MLYVDSILIRTDDLAEAERLTQAGGDLVHTTGVVPSHEGGDVTWASAVVRVPAGVAVDLGSIILGAELRGSPEQDVSSATGAVATTPAPVATTSMGTPLIPPRRRRSRRPRHRITCDTATKDRTPHAPTPGSMRP